MYIDKLIPGKLYQSRKEIEFLQEVKVDKSKITTSDFKSYISGFLEPKTPIMFLSYTNELNSPKFLWGKNIIFIEYSLNEGLSTSLEEII